MKIYNGVRTDLRTFVGTETSQGRAHVLPWRLDLARHSPTGLEWGYMGSGPAQLALAILADHFAGDDQRAISLYQDFKGHYVAHLRGDTWAMTSAQVADAVRFIESRRAVAP